MRKILFILLSLMTCFSYGQNKETFSVQSSACPKQMIGNLTVFVNPVSSRSIVPYSVKSRSRSNEYSVAVLKTTFKVEVEQSGDYYLLANTLSTYVQKDKFQEISVYVNGMYQGKLNNTEADWEIIGIKGKEKVSLNKGSNEIVFSSSAPFYPEIDAVQLTLDKSSLITTNAPYNAYKALAAKDAVTEKTKESWEVTPIEGKIVGNANATVWQNVPTVYTYHRKISVTSKDKMEIHTTPVESEDYYDVDTYMYLYKIDDPYHYSWTNDDFIGYHSKIEVTLPAGEYYLVIRAKQSDYASKYMPRQGLVNVYCNGALLNENVPISGYLIDAPVKTTGILNFFTNKTSASSQLFLIDGDRMFYNSEPYTYYPPADYGWQNGSRKKITFRRGVPNWKVLVTTTSAWWICFGKCDVYAGLKDAPSKYMDKFSNLKSGDAILMADDDSKYNSAAWAGGITDRKIWIGNSSKGSPYVWNSWDDYFGNNPARYQNAPTYTRNGGGARSVIVYSKDSTMTGITHFAVMNKANNQLHGFDCESKIGTWGRITHTEKSLYGSEYGKTYYSYYEVQSPLDFKHNTLSKLALPTVCTMEQSIEEGLSIDKKVELSASEKEELDGFGRLVLDKDFEKMYSDWVADYTLADNFGEDNAIFSGQEFQKLVQQGRKHWKKNMSFLCDKIFVNTNEYEEEQDLASVLLCEMVAPYYAAKMDSIKDDWFKNQYTEDGKYICPTIEYFTKRYVKSILEEEYTKANVAQGFDGNFIVLEGRNLKVNLAKDAVVSLQFQNVTTNSSLMLLNSQLMKKGKYVYEIDVLPLASGVNVCSLVVNGKASSVKLIK